ncbi:MAG: methyltransferase domain-containing protein [Phaeodactylibacter sp.]|nr:methyltransferase domain-containing protein [Phaeodactylibacter sp.]
MKRTEEVCRVPRSKEEARTSYNRLSKAYDILIHPFEKKQKQAGLDCLAANPGEKILEVGFGTGNNLLAIARSVGEKGAVAGIDISDEMLRIARRKLEAKGLAGNAHLTRGDATQLPYDDNAFDAIFMSFVLDLFDTPDILLVLQECKRVLKKGGRIVNVSLQKADTLSNRLYESLHNAFPAMIDCRPIRAGRSLEEAGFTVVEERDLSMWGLKVRCVLAEKGQNAE